MSLNFYETPDSVSVLSDDASFSNAFSVTVDGITGGVVHRRIYVRNDDPTKFYTDIEVTPVVLSGTDIVTGATKGYVWKLIVDDTQPAEEEWGLTSAGNTIALTDIGESGNGDTTTFLPLWIRIEVPRSSPVTSYQNIGLRIQADENDA